MNLSDATLLLGVPEGAGEAEIEAAFLAKSSDLRARIEGAPTDALRAKYEAQLVSLGAARDALLAAAASDAGGDVDAPVVSQTMADLPQAVPSYTPAPDGASPGEGLVLEPGTLLAGRYEVKERIGAGGMGAVFRVLDRTRGKDIAIKAMLPSLLENEKAKARFLNEARLSSDLSHPNIVNVYDVQEAESLTFLTMELLEGQSLRDYLKVHTRGLEVAEAVRIAVAVGEALAYAHGTTIHRDVKPENVFICEDGAIKLLDFGIAQVQSTSQLTKTGAAMGTAYYMAPEQLKGARDVDGRADQYALGVMLYEMLTAEIPQGRFADPHKVNREVPKKLSQAIVRAMEIAPDKRYGSIGDFLKAVSGKGRVSSAPRGARSGSSGGGGSMMPKVVAALGVAAVVALLVLYGGPLKDAVLEMIPDAEQEAQLEARALTLDGVVKGLQRRLEAAQRTLETTVRDGQSEVRRLEGNVRSARSDNDRRRAETALSRAGEQLQLAEEHSDAARDAVFESPDILAVDGQLSVAASRLRDKRYGEAATDLAAVEAVLTAKLALIDDAGDMVRARMAARTALADWRAVLADLPAGVFPAAVAAVEGLETEARQQQASWEFRAADETWSGIIDRLSDLLPEAQAWAKALNTGRSADYQAYLSGWPAGVYAEDAASRGRTAQNSEQRAAARRRDNADWATARTADNIEAYQGYLQTWPTGRHAAEAQTGLKAAEQRLAEQKRLAAIRLAEEKLAEERRQDNAGWAVAVKANTAKGFRAYMAAYPNGTHTADAQAGIGLAYDEGRGVPRDYAEAARWYRLAADQGNAAGQGGLGSMYINGTGVQRDQAEALRLFQLAEKQGHPRGQNGMGFLYDNGFGVPQNSAEAARQYRLAADQGYAKAQVNLGFKYAQGNGVTIDHQEAFRLTRLAADQGLAAAFTNLGWMYFNGIGVVNDIGEAVRHYRLAAEQGDAQGQSNMGQMYVNGFGVTKDEVVAFMWYSLGAAQGNPLGINGKNDLSKELSREELARARQLISDWRPSPVSIQDCRFGTACE